MSPKVSVITCSHNRPDLLRAAVESLRRQTDPDWEHLIYDDASTDPKVSETLAWAAEDTRVRVWHGEENLDRPSVLWNFMLDRAHGRYFTVLDDDNEKLPRFIEVMAGELDAESSLDIVTCGWVVVRRGEPNTDYYLNLSTNASVLANNSTCDGGAMLYRRELFERAGYFSEALRTNEDWDWMRRAVHVTQGVKNLHECHSTYRDHPASRMARCEALGNTADIAQVRMKALQSTLGIRIVSPSPEGLTSSQKDVAGSIERALSTIPWLKPGNDLAIVISPLQLSNGVIATGIEDCHRVLTIHMEDPYALEANLERVKAMFYSIPDVWVCTNDASTVPAYREIVGSHIIACPLLGVDTTIVNLPPETRNIDVLLCGYAYPSRKRFVNELLPLLKGRSVTLVGDGWDGCQAETIPTQDLENTYHMHMRAKTVICLQRQHGDCSDGPTEPETVNRGYMEGYFGPRVFVNSKRSSLQAFDKGDVVRFNDHEHLAQLLHNYLDGPRDQAADRFAEKCSLFTYRTRIARIINCVRTPRFSAQIP